MKVNSITSASPIYKNNNKQKSQISNPDNNLNYTAQNISPSFEGIFNFSKKGSEAKITAQQVIKKFEKKWQSSNKTMEDNYKKSIENIRANITDETAPLINQLFKNSTPMDKRLSEFELYDSDFHLDLLWIKDLAAILKRFPDSKKIMQEVADEKINGKPRFNLFDMGFLIFDYYKGTKVENETISTLIKAKNLDGSPKFDGPSIRDYILKKRQKIIN